MIRQRRRSLPTRIGAALVATAAGLLVLAGARASSAATPVAPRAALDATASSPAPAGTLDTAVFSGGCFWGTQGLFEHVKGVVAVTAGYAGGDARTAQYETVSTGETGQAESVEIVFDPSQVSYGDLLRVFFSVAHDPTEVNRQGPDVGSQYRSAIWYASDAQRRTAEAYIAQLTRAKFFPRPIVTQVAPLRGFYPAERYHQDYLIHHPDAPYIVINDLPKLHALQRELPALWRATPVTWVAQR